MAVIEIKDLGVKIGAQTVLKNLNLLVQPNEQWVITGPSGSGKTTLLNAIAGRQFYSGALKIKDGLRLVFVEQQHHFKNLSNTSDFYYQQRFNSFDANDSATVAQYLQTYMVDGDVISKNENLLHTLNLLHLTELLDTNLIQLSNGENKRLQIAIALLQKPELLLLDNPYIGLDVEARDLLNGLLTGIIKSGVQIIITVTHALPPFVTHILQLNTEAKEPKPASAGGQANKPNLLQATLLQQLTQTSEAIDFEYAVRMKNVAVSYGQKMVLQGVDWEVKKGERWVLSGANGAGKSTLLSLINADNPQAYANEIYLFDKRRGRGESIWDIKRLTGYVSPELHLFFDGSNSVFDVIASGLFDTIGLFRKVTLQQQQTVALWLQLMQVEHLAQRALRQLSVSQQRLVLLARALVKNPPLLILDEPTQGLDDEQLYFFKQVIEHICTHTDKTIIYVSHYKEEIPDCINRLIKLQDGKVMAIQ